MSSFRTRHILESPNIYDKDSDLYTQKVEKMKVDVDPILNKPIPLATFTWSSSDVQFTDIKTYDIPSSLFSSQNPLLQIPFRMSALYKLKCCLLFQVSGTMTHSGMLLISALPYGANTYTNGIYAGARSVNTLMASPHIFLAANEQTSACLPIPFFSGCDLLRCDPNTAYDTSNSNTSNFSTVLVRVLNPLGVPTSGSSTLQVSVHFMVTQADFYIPHCDATYVAQTSIVSSILDSGVTFLKNKTSDLIDAGREIVKNYTGLHNPNIPIPEKRVVTTGMNFLQHVDVPTFMYKMSPYGNFDRLDERYIFRTDVDEMSTQHIFSKPWWIGSVNVSTSDLIGKVIWSRPITPFQTQVTSGSFNKQAITPFDLIGSQSQFWTGGLKLIIQSSMSNFHFLKLLIVKNYSPVAAQQTQVPSFDSVSNLITDSIEFSAGGQVHVIDLPYNAPTPALNCSFHDYVTNAFQHAMYYVYLQQNLITNGTVVNNVWLNFYLVADDDFAFSGHSIMPLSLVTSAPAPSLAIVEEVPDLIYEAQTSAVLSNVAPQQNTTLLSSGDVKDSPKMNGLFRPNLSIRDYTRLLLPSSAFSINYNSTTGTVALLKVSELLGLADSSLTAGTNSSNMLRVAAHLFAGFNGGVKIRARFLQSSQNPEVHFSFIPPQQIMTHNVSGGFLDKLAFAKSAGTPILPTASVAAAALSYQNTIFNNSTTSNIRSGAITKVERDYTSPSSSSWVYFDFVIPYMSVLNFVGDINLRNIDSANYYAVDLGTLVLSIDSSAGTTSFPLNIQFDVALADEARFGLQTICVPMQIPAVAVSTVYYNQVPYMFRGSSAVFTTTPTIPLSLPTTVPSCYIGGSY